MTRWTAFPFLGEYGFDEPAVTQQWPRLHAGDAEPLPGDARVLQAWVLFHEGRFHAACQAGLAAGGPGLAVANKATCMYANYLEKQEATRLALFGAVAQRAQAQAAQAPRDVAAWYWLAYALGRYSQGISVAAALAQGLGATVKEALEAVLKLQPLHADAQIALGTFHAEVIDKVGPLIGGMTYGASRALGLRLLRDGLALNPDSAAAMTECANGLVMLEGEQRMAEATGLYERAAACAPRDATERLAVELARNELRA
jgi:hypothetical protein